MPTPCTAVSPAPEGGTCVFLDCAGPHSFEPRRPEILPSADVGRVEAPAPRRRRRK